MRRLLFLLFVFLVSVVLHEFIHLIQFVLIDDMEYTGWGFGINPFFYWTGTYPYSTKLIEVQAYGIQMLFLIYIALRNLKLKSEWGQKCVSC